VTSQSAWGVANAVPALSSQPQAPIPIRASAEPAPRPAPVAKIPSDVSRQLFPDGGKPVLVNATPAASVQQTRNLAPGSQRSPHHQLPPTSLPAPIGAPPQHASQAGMMPSPLVMAPPQSQYMPGRAPGAPPVGPRVPPQQVQRPPASYSPFDNPINKFPYMFPMELPMKAPGFRSGGMPSPQMLSSFGVPEDGFSRAPGAPGIRPAHSVADQTPPGSLSSLSISTNMAHLFASGGGDQHDSTGGSPRQILPLKDQYTTIDQPMTLPRISSSLNPNASEFTGRLSDMAQQSPRSAGKEQTSPVDFRRSPPSAAYQQKNTNGGLSDQVI